jgi:signal transduction histidine kinase
MEAVARGPVIVLSRRRMISIATIALSVAITAAMSLVFHRALRVDMLITGLVCAVIVDQLIRRVTRHYRRQLAIANATLEQRVRDRTDELERANRALREAAAEQVALRDELLARDRMATAGMVAAGVTHEIRSPLAVISICTEELQTMVRGETERELLRDAGEAADRIATILCDLSSIARPVDDPLGPVDLAAAIDSATRLAAYRFGHGVVLEKLPCAVPAVYGNACRLVQVLLNLLVNASRATGGTANTIRIGAETRGDDVVVTVSDTGTGMSPATLARLFQPFFTTGRASGGTGLGLAICRSLVERMGGTIALDSELGVGTTARVTLRRA